MSALPVLLAVLLFTRIDASAQYVPVRRIPMPVEPMGIGALVRSGTSCWAVSSSTALVMWREERQKWEACARYSMSNYAAVVAPGEHSGLYVLRSTQEVDYVDSLGQVRVIGSVDRIRPLQAIVSIPGGLLLEASATPGTRRLFSSVFIDGERKSLDTLPVNAPESVRLSYVSACSSAMMTVIDRLPDGKPDTASYRYDPVDGSWNRMTHAFGSAEHIVLANGGILSISNRHIVRRSACDAVDIPAGPDRAVDKLLRLADGRVVAYVQSQVDTAAPLVFVSTDDGATFAPHPAFDDVDGYIQGVAERADGALIAAIGSHLLRILDDTVVVIPSPVVETGLSYPDLVPVLHGASRFFALHTQCCQREMALHDPDAGRWYGLTFDTGERCNPQYVYPFRSFTIVNDQSTTGILRGMDTVATVVEDTSGKALIGAALQAIQLAPDTLLLFANKFWYTVDVRTATATVMETDWPRTQQGYTTGPVGRVILGSQPRRIVVGTTEAWNIGTDSLTTVVDRYGILMSTDEGRSWMMSNEGIGTDIYCWAMEHRGDTIYALMSYALHPTTYTQAKMYRSDDQGRTWRFASLLPVEIRNRMRMSIASDGTLYVGGRGLVQSTDGGITWQFVTGSWEETELPTHAIVHGDRLIVATDRGLYISIDPVLSAKDDPTSDVGGQDGAYWDGQAFVIRDTGVSDGQRIAVYDLTGRMIHVVPTASCRFVPAMPPPAGPYVVVGRTTTLVLVHGQ
ncbi:MAG: exo-alpha-sialidase ['Candidatus Kapabacteria' thiocyanatum]|nr:exo-alpha-sialidase ['Candidatus Kapabacteria' thiocyanatum]